MYWCVIYCYLDLHSGLLYCTLGGLFGVLILSFAFCEIRAITVVCADILRVFCCVQWKYVVHDVGAAKCILVAGSACIVAGGWCGSVGCWVLFMLRLFVVLYLLFVGGLLVFVS